MRFGDLTLTLVNGGNFRLDGGAMHGVVPKTIWSRLVSCDALNRCEYATNCLLVEGRGHRLLIETGNGDKFSAKEREIYGIDHDGSAESHLRALGIEPESIDLVAMTHLHFDHSGGTTRRSASGSVAPVFARARHVIQRQELDDATHPHERNRASYLTENFQPLAEAGLLQLVDGEVEIAPGIRVIPTPGHTRGHQSVLIDDGAGHKVLFLGDVIPTALHVRLPFIMAYDLDVVGTLETKRALIRRASEERWLLVFGHDTETRAGYLGLDPRGQLVITEPVSLA
ncbi:MAG: MBL fold metallo-hydrolase [Polyangia bacterium]|jgi:glyoxylase-like metal-dependent hydrolase (beta-lactamase superfamily II)